MEQLFADAERRARRRRVSATRANLAMLELF